MEYCYITSAILSVIVLKFSIIFMAMFVKVFKLNKEVAKNQEECVQIIKRTRTLLEDQSPSNYNN